jgi:hypothetical protein
MYDSRLNIVAALVICHRADTRGALSLWTFL